MQVSYNLRYQKSHILNRLLIDKEGEIIIYEKGFRLKGKGAADKGEMINFSEIKEFYYRNERIFFITFNKEKYVLSEAGSLFNQLLLDIFRSRNEFLVDALFLRQGKMKGEFEATFERYSKFNKIINKSKGKLKLHEGSLVVIPELQDAFGINFNFVNFYEFDELDYTLKIIMDDGMTIIFSQLGNEFEFFEEKMNATLGGMYEILVNDVLKENFPQFHAAVLLKLAYKMKGGKAVCFKDLQKIDKELASEMKNFICDDEVFKQKSSILAELIDENDIYYSLAKDYTVEKGFIKWILFAIPEKNIVAFSILPRWEGNGKAENNQNSHDTFFYKIIMEKGTPADKMINKIQEIEQSLVQLKFAKDPCYQDKRELRYSPFQYAIRKLPFLRILRKSYVGKAAHKDIKEWQNQAQKLLQSATISS